MAPRLLIVIYRPGPGHDLALSRPTPGRGAQPLGERLSAIEARDVDYIGNNEETLRPHLGLSRPFHHSFAPALTGRTLNTRRHTRHTLLIPLLIYALPMVPVIAL